MQIHENVEFYSKWLILPALLGAAVFIAQIVTDRVDLEAAPVFSILIALWGAFLVFLVLFCCFSLNVTTYTTHTRTYTTYTIHTRYIHDTYAIHTRLRYCVI